MGVVVSLSKVYNFHTDSSVLVEDLKEGDKVLIPKLGSSKITVSGETFYIAKITDIYCKITEE